MDGARKQRLFAVCLALLVVAVVGGSAWYVNAQTGTAALTTVATEDRAPLSSADTHGQDPEEADEEKPDEEADPALEASEAAQDAQDPEAAGKEQASEGADDQRSEGAADTASPAGRDGSAPDTASGSQEGTDPASVPSSAPAAETDAPQSAPQAQPAPEPEPAPTSLSVHVVVDGTPAGGGRRDTTVTLDVGATVYDALLASGAGVNARGTSYGTYVAAIDGLAEFDHGGMSGWVYAVNGVEPATACSNYRLSDGDSVVWTYVNVEY